MIYADEASRLTEESVKLKELWNHVECQIKKAALSGNSRVGIKLDDEFNTNENRVIISKSIKLYGYATDCYWYNYDNEIDDLTLNISWGDAKHES